MREIKFRWWSEAERKMYTWEDMLKFCDWQHLSSKNVMQFIGPLDKNKIEIYAGDILCLKTKSWNNNKDWPCWKKEIVWIKCLNLTCTKAYFDLEAKKMWDNGYSYEDYSDDWELTENIEVIGNIYQHPELLAEAK